MLTLTDNRTYTVFANDLVEEIAPVILETSGSDFNHDSASVRVLHGAPSAPAVDVYVLQENRLREGDQPVLANVPFGAASDYLSLPPGQYFIFVTVAGTSIVAIESGPVTVQGEQAYTVVAQDAPGAGAPFSLLLLADE